MLKSNYNIQTLSFLIASFNEIVDSFGENNKSVAFYKSQVSGMISIGHVKQEEARIIEEVVGMTNTDAVKWATAKQKISQFIQAMNTISNADSKNAVALLINQMAQSKQISENVADIVRKIFDVYKSDASASCSFGKFQTEKHEAAVKASIPTGAKSTTASNPSATTSGAIHIGAGRDSSISTGKTSDKTTKMQAKIDADALILAKKISGTETSNRAEVESCKKAVEIAKKLELHKLPQYKALLDYVDDRLTLTCLVDLAHHMTNKNIILKINNIDAVCSCDPSYRRCELAKVFDNSTILDLLTRHADVKAGTEKEVGDPCHPTKVMDEISTLTHIIKEISWEAVVRALTDWTRDINSMA